MLNRIIIMGRLTRDPELRHTQSGTAVASFSLAVDRDFKNQNGEKETDFIDVVAWRNSAEFVSRYFAKGRGRRRGLPGRLPPGRLRRRVWRRLCTAPGWAVWPAGRRLSALQLRRRRLHGAGR